MLKLDDLSFFASSSVVSSVSFHHDVRAMPTKAAKLVRGTLVSESLVEFMLSLQ